MLDRQSSLFFALLLIMLICFDALQQKFYLDTFDLANEPVTLLALLYSHFLRWMVWVVVTLPFIYMIWRKVFQGINIKLHLLLIYACFSMLIAVSLISVVSIWRQELVLNDNWTEFFVFFFYQKGLVFIMAFGVLFFWVKNQSQAKRIDAQWIEIKNLKKESALIIDAHKTPNTVPHLNVKSGNLVRSIPSDLIIWIQADDYCVKVHTKDQSYYLRKSMKFLEKELEPFGFIRVHRGALLNLNFLDHVDFEYSVIRLKNQFELPLSKSGGSLLKQRMKEKAI